MNSLRITLPYLTCPPPGKPLVPMVYEHEGSLKAHQRPNTLFNIYFLFNKVSHVIGLPWWLRR